MGSFFKGYFSSRGADQGSEGKQTAAAPAGTAPESSAAGARRPPDADSLHSNDPLVRNESRAAEKTGQGERLTKREKLKRHWKRFWVFYIIGLVIFLAIFLPVFFLVIIPAIIQRLMNEASLPINGGTLALHSPDELKVSIKTTVAMPAGIVASLDPITLQLYNSNTTTFSPFMAVDLPKQHLDGPTNIDAPESIVRISNKTELTNWLRYVIRDPIVDLSLRGDSHINLGAIKSSVHLEKTTPIRALNHLRGFGVPNIRLVVPPEADGANVRGQLLFPNHTPLHLGLGNLTFNMWSGPVMLGTVEVHNMLAAPGDNIFDFRGVLLLHDLLPNIGAILASQASALGRGNIVLGVSGNSTMVNGEHIAFFEEVLNKERFETELSVVSVVMQVLGGLIDPASNNGTSALLDTISGVLGNKTLMDGIVDKLNASHVVDRLNSTADPVAIPSNLLKRVQRELTRTALKSVVRDFRNGRSKPLWSPTQ
ncbi:hypothetical protein PspLS_11808 [Pyricularia sp. CBS 133598]|nr:hypothetical protein PspLS_11808 [Pyricularia sp. CBS 133598]